MSNLYSFNPGNSCYDAFKLYKRHKRGNRLNFDSLFGNSSYRNMKGQGNKEYNKYIKDASYDYSQGSQGIQLPNVSYRDKDSTKEPIKLKPQHEPKLKVSIINLLFKESIKYPDLSVKQIEMNNFFNRIILNRHSIVQEITDAFSLDAFYEYYKTKHIEDKDKKYNQLHLYLHQQDKESQSSKYISNETQNKPFNEVNETKVSMKYITYQRILNNVIGHCVELRNEQNTVLTKDIIESAFDEEMVRIRKDFSQRNSKSQLAIKCASGSSSSYNTEAFNKMTHNYFSAIKEEDSNKENTNHIGSKPGPIHEEPQCELNIKEEAIREKTKQIAKIALNMQYFDDILKEIDKQHLTNQLLLKFNSKMKDDMIEVMEISKQIGETIDIINEKEYYDTNRTYKVIKHQGESVPIPIYQRNVIKSIENKAGVSNANQLIKEKTLKGNETMMKSTDKMSMSFQLSLMQNNKDNKDNKEDIKSIEDTRPIKENIAKAIKDKDNEPMKRSVINDKSHQAFITNKPNKLINSNTNKVSTQIHNEPKKPNKNKISMNRKKSQQYIVNDDSILNSTSLKDKEDKSSILIPIKDARLQLLTKAQAKANTKKIPIRNIKPIKDSDKTHIIDQNHINEFSIANSITKPFSNKKKNEDLILLQPINEINVNSNHIEQYKIIAYTFQSSKYTLPRVKKRYSCPHMTNTITLSFNDLQPIFGNEPMYHHHSISYIPIKKIYHTPRKSRASVFQSYKASVNREQLQRLYERRQLELQNRNSKDSKEKDLTDKTDDQTYDTYFNQSLLLNDKDKDKSRVLYEAPIGMRKRRSKYYNPITNRIMALKEDDSLIDKVNEDNDEDNANDNQLLKQFRQIKKDTNKLNDFFNRQLLNLEETSFKEQEDRLNGFKNEFYTNMLRNRCYRMRTNSRLKFQSISEVSILYIIHYISQCSFLLENQMIRFNMLNNIYIISYND